MSARHVRATTITPPGRHRNRSLSPARGILIATTIGVVLWLLVVLAVHAFR